MVKSDKNYDVSCKSRTVCLACLLRHLVKHCRSDDNSLGEKIWLKPHLKSQDLQGEVITLTFLFNRMLRTKICSEFWVRKQRLIRLFVVVDTLRERLYRNRACIFHAVIKSPKLIFISLKRRTFPLITT